MAEPGEECELQQLVPSDEDHRVGDDQDYGEVTPPVSPSGISTKVTQTSPTTPASNKVSSPSPVAGAAASGNGGTGVNTGANSGISGAGSIRSASGAGVGAGGTSQASSSSRSLSRIATAPTIATRLLYVNEKLPSSRQPKSSHSSLTSRPHSNKKDVTDVRRMETALLKLLEDFHSGKLRAFGKDCSMEQMTGIREQQERLARLHFELGAQQELFPPLSAEGLRQGAENMTALMTSLEQLSESIEKLHSFNS